MIGVTLLHRKGYFRQTLDAGGNQTESPAGWNYEEVLEPMVPRAFVPIAGRAVMVRAWRYIVRGVFGHTVPVYFLDTDLKENTPWEQSLTESLYDGDGRHRLCQEVVLGMGGVAMLQALSYKNVSTHHMNEGHAAFLTWHFWSAKRRAAIWPRWRKPIAKRFGSAAYSPLTRRCRPAMTSSPSRLSARFWRPRAWRL